MPKLAALLVLFPLTASADEGPITSPSQVTTTTTTTVTTTTLAPPSATPVDEDPCHVSSRHWRERMRGKLSIGVSKSHVEMRDDESEGSQKSFVARLNGRRGWSLEVELSKLSLDGGDTAKTGGVSIVKTFGHRRIAPYVLAGGGGGKYETAAGVEDRVRFGEVGAGVMLRGKRLSIGVDMRRGVRGLADREEMSAERGVVMESERERDHYVRGRVVGLVTF